MVVESMLVYHFVDPDLSVETFFEKDGTAESGGIDFVIGDICTCAHLYWSYKNFHVEPVCFFVVFFGDKKYLLKAL